MKRRKEFKVIECGGTPFEIGVNYGEACVDNIKHSLELFLQGLSMSQKAAKEEVLANAMKFLPQVSSFDPYLIELLKGQAKGADMEFEEVFALRCMSELAIKYNHIASLCTSFAATGKATKDGKTILGQTIDWVPGIPIDLLKVHHADGLVQLKLILGSWVEYTLNSTGYGMCANSTFNTDFAFNIPLGCYIPKAMRQPNVSEAMEVFKSAARGIGYYHLASSGGEMIGIESVCDDFELILPERDMLVHSNHYLTERFKERDAVTMVVPDSPFRVGRMNTLLGENYGELTPQIMMTLLSDHENHPHSVCSHVDMTRAPMISETVAAFVMVPEDKKMFVAYGNPCSYEFVEYQLFI